MPLTVSVILAVRDGERYLVDAIDTVLSEGVDELVVVDDGSIDGTSSILAAYGNRIIALHQPPTGQAAALNHGIGRASGQLLSFQDADDLWVAGRQQRLQHALLPELDAVYGSMVEFASPDLAPSDAAQLRINEAPQRGEMLQCMLVRRESFDKVGLFDTGRQSAHNIDWASRARAIPLRVGVITDVVFQRRIHATNGGRVRATENRVDLTRVMRAHLDRKRSL